MTESNNKSIISNLGLEELKRIYNSEIERTKNIDSKASTVLGFVSLIVTILLFILKYFIDHPGNMTGLYIYGILISMIFLAASLILLINAFRIRDFLSPFPLDKKDNLRLYLTCQEDKFQEMYITKYLNSIQITYSNNQSKAKSLKWATILLAIGILITLISTFLILWLYWKF